VPTRAHRRRCPTMADQHPVSDNSVPVAPPSDVIDLLADPTDGDDVAVGSKRSTAASNQGPGGGKKCRALSADDLFDRLTAKYSWLARDANARRVYEHNHTVRCTLCNSAINAVQRSNVGGHEASKSHKDAASAVKGTPTLREAQARAPPSERAAQERKVVFQELRAVLLAVAMEHVPRTVIPSVFNQTMLDALKLLTGNGYTFGAQGTMFDDQGDAHAMLRREITALLKDKYCAIITDGATTCLMGRQKPLAIMLSSSLLKQPLLLHALMDPAVSTAAETATAIRASLSSYGVDLATQVVEVMGDNVSFNDALAAELGLPRGKCLAHALNLVVKAVCNVFPDVDVYAFGLHSVITAGGTVARTAELRTLDSVNKRTEGLLVYPNRFASVVNFIKHLLEPSAAGEKGGVYLGIREWLETGSSLQGAHPTTESSHTLGAVRAAYGDDIRCMCLWIVYSILYRVPELIATASANAQHVAPTFKNNMETFYVTLVQCHTYPEAVIEHALTRGPLQYDAAELKVIKAAYVDKIKLAAKAAMDSYKKHITPALDQLLMRFRLDPRNEPDAFPEGQAAAETASIRSFFHCLEAEASFTLVAEYTTYRDAWPSIPAAEKRLSMSEFWKCKRLNWPLLSKLGMWYAERLTSSIAAERTFGIMRGIESHNRMSMVEETFQAELSFKVNGWVMRNMLGEKVTSAQRLPQF
jgi:hypothetical protein